MEYLRQGPPGYYIDAQGRLIPEKYIQAPHQIAFGSGFTPAELVRGGVISSVIALILGAGLPGALVMGFGSMIVEAGSTHIPIGWKRYILGLFKKPHV